MPDLALLLLGVILGAGTAWPVYALARETQKTASADHHTALLAERRRVDDLLRLLESKAAPAEFAAYVSPAYMPPEVDDPWVTDDTGLIMVRASEMNDV